MNSIVYGDTADELMTEAAKTEGLFYQLYESKTGKLIGRVVVSIDMLAKVVQKEGEAEISASSFFLEIKFRVSHYNSC